MAPRSPRPNAVLAACSRFSLGCVIARPSGHPAAPIVIAGQQVVKARRGRLPSRPGAARAQPRHHQHQRRNPPQLRSLFAVLVSVGDRDLAQALVAEAFARAWASRRTISEHSGTEDVGGAHRAEREHLPVAASRPCGPVPDPELVADLSANDGGRRELR